MEFWLSIADSQSSSDWLSPNANKRTPPIELHATSPVLYYEFDITLPKPFVSHKPTSKRHHLLLPFLIFFPISCQCFIKHYNPLHYITLYRPISPPFLPPPPSSDTFAPRRSKVGQVTITSLRLDFTHPPPHFLSRRRKTPPTFFNYATRNCTLLNDNCHP